MNALRVMLVEDNKVSADMLSRRLGKRGIEVRVFPRAQLAIDIARTEPPDLILMDLALPDMSGLEATALLQSDPSLRTIPVIMITGHALATDRKKCLDAGCAEFETKPARSDSILTKIHNCTGWIQTIDSPGS